MPSNRLRGYPVMLSVSSDAFVGKCNFLNNHGYTKNYAYTPGMYGCLQKRKRPEAIAKANSFRKTRKPKQNKLGDSPNLPKMLK